MHLPEKWGKCRGWAAIPSNPPRPHAYDCFYETTWQFRRTGSPHNLSVDIAAESLEYSPGQLAVSQVTDVDKEALRFACCAAPAAPLLVTAFLLYVCPPSVLTPFDYSALVPHAPRLDSTLDCVTVLIFAEPYIIDCFVTSLFLSKLLHFTYRVVDSKFRGLVG